MYITHQKGEIAQLKVEQRAIEKGWIPARPTIEARFDLLLYDGKKIYRAQVKYSTTQRQGVVAVDLRSECRNSGYSKLYTSEEIDVVLVYSPEMDKILWIGPELFEEKGHLSFRILPSKNNQTKNTRNAEDFLW